MFEMLPNPESKYIKSGPSSAIISVLSLLLSSALFSNSIISIRFSFALFSLYFFINEFIGVSFTIYIVKVSLVVLFSSETFFEQPLNSINIINKAERIFLVIVIHLTPRYLLYL